MVATALPPQLYILTHDQIGQLRFRENTSILCFFNEAGAVLSFNITSEAMISNGARYCQMVDLNALHMSAAKIKNSLPARPWPWATGAGKTCMILQLVLFQISWMDKDTGMNYKHALDSRF